MGKSWVHYFKPEIQSNGNIMGYLPPKKVRVQASVGNVMHSIFLVLKHVILADYLQEDVTNAVSTVSALWRKYSVP